MLRELIQYAETGAGERQRWKGGGGGRGLPACLPACLPAAHRLLLSPSAPTCSPPAQEPVSICCWLSSFSDQHTKVTTFSDINTPFYVHITTLGGSKGNMGVLVCRWEGYWVGIGRVTQPINMSYWGQYLFYLMEN